MLNDKYNGDILPCAVNITNPQKIIECISQLKKDIPQIDILINNAGANSFTPAMQVTEDIWDQIIDVNLKGAFFISQQVASWMIAQKRGNSKYRLSNMV